MIRFIHRMMLGFVAVFGVSVVAIIIYAVYWQFPEQRCSLHGNWWDSHDRICAKPVFLPNITHRPIGSPKLKPGEVQPIIMPSHA
jgi:hypothetical protein